MSTFVRPIALAVTFVALAGAAAAQSSNSNNTGRDASGVWEDNANTSSQTTISRGVGKSCAGDANCPDSNARPSDPGTSGSNGASDMQEDPASWGKGAGGTASPRTDDGAMHR